MHMRILPIAILLTISEVLCGQYGGIRKLTNLQELKQVLQQDTLAAFEYKCAQEFHLLINEYRTSKRIKPLAFNDSLWLVARNHAVYMAENREFSHNQTKGKVLFSGESPLKRIEFAYNKRVDLVCGENIAQIWHDDRNAAELAREAFALWKHSSGHNQNMLNKDYKHHGTAFICQINEQNTIGDILITDLFAEVISFRQENKIGNRARIIISENSYARNTRARDSEKRTKFNMNFIKKELGNKFYYLRVRDSLPDQWKRSDRLSKNCLNRSDALLSKQSNNKYLNATVAVEGKYTTTEHASIKPSLISRFLGKDDHTAITMLYGINEEHFDADKIAREVYKTWRENLPIDTQHLNYGYHIGVQKKGSSYWICVCIETGE
jgi:uncharacterized protein YkwD